MLFYKNIYKLFMKFFICVIILNFSSDIKQQAPTARLAASWSMHNINNIYRIFLNIWWYTDQKY